MTKVLELGGFAAGFCGRLFVHAGAEVVRIEGALPPVTDAWVSERAMDIFLHTGKERVGFTDASALRRLAADADVVVAEGMPDEIEALGWESLDGIRVAITPFGMTGPRRQWHASASVLQAMAGQTYLMGDPGVAPLTLPGHYTEYQSGQYGYISAAACLHAIDRSGASPRRSVDISMLETLLSLSQMTTVMWTCSGRVRMRHGSNYGVLYPANLFPCADGWFHITATHRFWGAFARMLGRPELEHDPRFATSPGRTENQEALDEIIVEVLGQKTREEIQRLGEAARVPAGALKDLDEVLVDPHLSAREFWHTVEGIRVPSLGFRFRDESAGGRNWLPVPAKDGRTRRRGLSTTREQGSMPDGKGPLAGVRILDLTHVWAGPLGTRILGDLGADVVKVERPMGRGGVSGTPGAGNYPGGEKGEDPWNRQATFLKLNRNKRSLAIDLKNPEGRGVFLDLVRVADVVIENFSARTMPGLGLGYDVLREANERIIYVSMPGYGRTGPYSGRVAYGPSVEAMTGLNAVMGYSPDEPRNTAVALPDPIGGVTAAAAVVAALNRREATGRGAFVERSMHESGVSLMGEFLVERQLGANPQPMGNAHPAHAYSDVLRTRGDDEWIAVTCKTETDRATLEEITDGDASDHDKHDLTARLQAAGIPAGPVTIAPDILADPQVSARRYFVRLEREDLPSTPMPGSPMVIDGDFERSYWYVAPRLGEHNRQVLEDWLGNEADVTARLERDGVLVDRPPG
ncbi:MAG: CoA transferase [Gammaproteobacteria bacterium]|nr:CoA transferase [Gammaproteobacteria bacterium]